MHITELQFLPFLWIYQHKCHFLTIWMDGRKSMHVTWTLHRREKVWHGSIIFYMGKQNVSFDISILGDLCVAHNFVGPSSDFAGLVMEIYLPSNPEFPIILLYYYEVEASFEVFTWSQLESYVVVLEKEKKFGNYLKNKKISSCQSMNGNHHWSDLLYF